jgi:hypothetical protein
VASLKTCLLSGYLVVWRGNAAALAVIRRASCTVVTALINGLQVKGPLGRKTEERSRAGGAGGEVHEFASLAGRWTFTGRNRWVAPGRCAVASFTMVAQNTEGRPKSILPETPQDDEPF